MTSFVLLSIIVFGGQQILPAGYHNNSIDQPEYHIFMKCNNDKIYTTFYLKVPMNKWLVAFTVMIPILIEIIDTSIVDFHHLYF